jgi:hypothetical protein
VGERFRVRRSLLRFGCVLMTRLTHQISVHPGQRLVAGALAVSLTGLLLTPPIALASELMGRRADVALGHRATGTGMGTSIAWAGDTDGDGLDELLVGATHGRVSLGEALLVHGWAMGRNVVPGRANAAVYRRGPPEIFLGEVVASAGDVDGDGYPDVWIGDGETVYLLPGSARGLVPMTAALAVVRAGFGYVQILGGTDLSGDGVADLVIGSLNDGAFVLDGPFSGLIDADRAARLQVWNSHDACEEFGKIVAVGSDLDDDGHQDLLVGSDNYGLGCDTSRHLGFVRADRSGRIDLEDLGAPVTVIIERNVREAAMVGDVNGDGFDDLAVSTLPGGDNRILWGPITSDVSISGAPGWTIEWPFGESGAGWAIRGAGDIDGDGKDEFAIAGQDEGYDETVFVVPGAAAGLEDWPARSLRVILSSEAELEEDGLLGGHDADGDGIPELVIATMAGHGQVYVLKGSTMAALLP